MLELAFCAALMVSCLAGTVQFGYTFYIYDQLVSAAGNGARYAATRTYRAASPGDIQKGKEAIRNMVVFGDARPAPGTQPVVPGLTPQNVDVAWIGSGPAGPDAVDVSIVNYTMHALMGSFTFDRKPMAEFPYVGRYAPSEREP